MVLSARFFKDFSDRGNVSEDCKEQVGKKEEVYNSCPTPQL
jgi:hypothetical protein